MNVTENTINKALKAIIKVAVESGDYELLDQLIEEYDLVLRAAGRFTEEQESILGPFSIEDRRDVYSSAVVLGYERLGQMRSKGMN